MGFQAWVGDPEFGVVVQISTSQRGMVAARHLGLEWLCGPPCAVGMGIFRFPAGIGREEQSFFLMGNPSLPREIVLFEAQLISERRWHARAPDS